MTGRDLLQVTKAAAPFFVLMLLSILFISVFPNFILWPVQYMVQ